MKKLFLHVLQEAFYIILFPFDLLIPKRNDYWLFGAKDKFPWADNLRSIFDKISEDEKILPIILYNGMQHRSDIEKIYQGKRYILARRFSIKGMWYFMRAKVCFVAYTNKELYSMMFPLFRHIIINVWHGIPIKAIALGEPRREKYNHKFLNPNYKFCNYYICSSKIDRLAMSACMMHNLNRVWITGLPRNDLLFNETALAPDLKNEEESLKAVLNGRKLILYAPTFRDWNDNINPVEKENRLGELVEVAKKYNAVVGVRKHPLDSSINWESNPEIINCGGAIYQNVNVLLRSVDCLITDYSSIWVDYLLLDKPIIGFCYDYERYLKGRSLLYNFDDIFPGDITKNTDELITSIEYALNGSDNSREKRNLSRNMFYSYSDNQSTVRVIEKVKELLK